MGRSRSRLQLLGRYRAAYLPAIEMKACTRESATYVGSGVISRVELGVYPVHQGVRQESG